MIVRFLLGSGLGALVGTGLLAILSVNTPVPGAARAVAANADTKPAPAEEPAAEVVEAPGVATPEAAPTPSAEAGLDDPLPEGGPQDDPTEPVALTEEAPAETPVIGDAPETPVVAALDENGPQPPSDTAEPSVAAAPEAPAELAGDVMPAPAEVPAAGPGVETAAAPDAPVAPEVDGSDLAAPGDLAEAAPAGTPTQPERPLAETAPAAVEPPGLPPLTPEEEAMLAQIAAEGPGSALPPGETAPEALPATAPAEELAEAEEPPAADPAPSVLTERTDDKVLRSGETGSTLPSTPALTEEGGGVTTGRLPRIGETTPPAAETAEAAPADTRPIAAFAAEFDNPEGKPGFAIVLIDDGAAGTDRAALAALPFPVSFALDPSDPNVAAYASIYRDAGKEIVMLASALPKGAQAADVEVALSVMASALPEAVAVMDLPQRAFQGDRPLASLVVPAVGASGRGLLTWDQGLNAADQVARREDIPAAVAFRDLDGADEAGAVIRRYLDRAAFKAAQEGRVTVVGRTRPETVAALLEWAVEGRAATVALAPLTAVLSVD